MVETYGDGTSGYRIWSDNYCEQWGCSAGSLNGYLFSINLLKSFKDTNMNVQLVVFHQTTSDGAAYFSRLAGVTVSTISYFIYGGTTLSTNNPCVSWRACGYIA